jgi:phage FluMu gp28-like protein
MINHHVKKEFFLGLDLGRKRDHSALVILERTFEAKHTRYVDSTTRWEQSMIVRYARQFPLGKSYGDLSREVARVYRATERLGPAVLVFDQTGVGDAVDELIKDNLRGANVEGVVITQELKRDIYAAIETVLEKGELKIPTNCHNSNELKQELLTVEIRRVGQGYKYGAFHKDAHDDMVMALGLACWRERFNRPRLKLQERIA